MGLWIYKNNTENPNGAYGEWAEFFELAKKSRSGKQRWGGPDVTEQPAAKKLAESMQVEPAWDPRRLHTLEARMEPWKRSAPQQRGTRLS